MTLHALRTDDASPAPVRELELKARVDDLAGAIRQVMAAGATRGFAGRLSDRRYDTRDGRLRTRREMLRTRARLNADRLEGELTWKGPTHVVDGYKSRLEVPLAVGNPTALDEALARDGFVLIRAVDRDVREFFLNGATIRFESYPRLDDLVEVEGDPPSIETAIRATGIPRSAFSVRGIPFFAEAFLARTGIAPAIADADLPPGVASSLRPQRPPRTHDAGWTLTDAWKHLPRGMTSRLITVLANAQAPMPPGPQIRPPGRRATPAR
jgi:adenylate cyclase class IV